MFHTYLIDLLNSYCIDFKSLNRIASMNKYWPSHSHRNVLLHPYAWIFFPSQHQPSLISSVWNHAGMEPITFRRLKDTYASFTLWAWFWTFSLVIQCYLYGNQLPCSKKSLEMKSLLFFPLVLNFMQLYFIVHIGISLLCFAQPIRAQHDVSGRGFSPPLATGVASWTRSFA